MSTVRANTILDAAGGTTATVNGYTPTASNMAGRNKIINGDMRISQRGTSFTSSGGNQYLLDRWFEYGSVASKFTIAQSSTAPAGFIKSMLITSSAATSLGASDQYRLEQDVEGLNVTDLGWGTADAQPVTISFRVRCSLTGTFGGSLRNNAADRSYPFTYTISSANTWETKTVTVAGDTSGTWLTTNSIGIRLTFGLGVGTTLSGTAGVWAGANYASATGATSVVGTNGATFYITGVQLEAGSVATPFEHRHYGTELALCQRYFNSSTEAFTVDSYGSVFGNIDVGANVIVAFPVTMRATPTLTVTESFNGGNSTVTAYLNSHGFNRLRRFVSSGSGGVRHTVNTYQASAEL